MNLNATTAAGQWEAFSAILKRQGASARDLALGRLRFYGGMEGMQRINGAIGHEDMTEQQALTVLAGVAAELVEFGRAIGGRLAEAGMGPVQ